MNIRRAGWALVWSACAGCATQPAPDVADEGGPRKLTPAEIHRVVRASFHTYRQCYAQHALERDPEAQGRAATYFVIGAGGRVVQAKTKLSGSLPAAVGSCLEEAFRALRFPPPDKGVVSVHYPIDFTPG